MNILKPLRFIIIGILLLFLVSLGVSLLIPSKINISRAIDIQADKDSIYPLVINPEKWSLWNPIFSDNNRLNYKSINIIPISITDSMLLFRLDQKGKREVTNGWHFYVGRPGTTTVQWFMTFTLKWYPWEKLKSLFFENAYGPLMEQGLNNLKNRTENH